MWLIFRNFWSFDSFEFQWICYHLCLQKSPHNLQLTKVLVLLWLHLFRTPTLLAKSLTFPKIQFKMSLLKSQSEIKESIEVIRIDQEILKKWIYLNFTLVCIIV